MELGLYEEIISHFRDKQIDKGKFLAKREKLDSADSHDYLAQYLYKILAQGLAHVSPANDLNKGREREENKINQQIKICNEIIDVLNNSNKNLEAISEFKISDSAEKLLSVIGLEPKKLNPPHPDTPLSIGSLLTSSHQDPSLISQLCKEIQSADRIDLLISFIKWSGIRLLKEQLEAFANIPGNQLRIISTSYMGATDLKAIEWLEKLPNTEIKISYDKQRTRLHAKAFCFYRKTGFSTAYVGSANISRPALTDGLEWTVKISQYEQPYQWGKITASFETYWNDKEFEEFTSEQVDRLRESLSTDENNNHNNFILPNFDLKPYGYQQEVLDQIKVERDLQQRSKHLIVAATGTGKTMIAAFDFKQWRRDFLIHNNKNEPKLLFIAHRKEILQQALSTFRSVIRDQNYGDLMVDGHQPSQMDRLFISVQTINAKNFTDKFDKSDFDYIVIDEFHHASAPSYQKLLNHFKPKSLIGLTATPDRMDGTNVNKYFDEHVTYEIRLPDAINRKLLCPFHYYGVTDDVDYTGLKWQKGGYVQSEISDLLTGDDRRANLILEKINEAVLDILDARGLGFCVSKKHAEFMAFKFNQSGVPSHFLTADSSAEERKNIKRKLINKEINFIFVVDLYNEGVDIPEIDTILFLRPTESLTIFLQQLGRGLRNHEDKDNLLVLDFVGQSHNNFRYDLRFNALINNKKYRIDDELEEGFPHLPSGCSVQLERKAREYILNNIKNAFYKKKPKIIQHIRSFENDSGKQLSLNNFTEYHKMDIAEIYKRDTWSRLCVEAGVIPDFFDVDEDQLKKGFKRIQHTNDNQYIEKIINWLKNGFKESELSFNEIRQLTMLHFTLFGKNNAAKTLAESWGLLLRNTQLKLELEKLLIICGQKILSLPEPFPLPFETPLKLHGRYTLDEVLAGLGYLTFTKQPPMREGVLHLKNIHADAFFITLNKSEKHYSPTTLYEDYAISDKLFHWQSQSNTSESSATGQRYISHEKNSHSILLFVREEQKKNGLAEPYYFIGPAKYVSHEGSRPMSIVWELDSPLPAHLLRSSAHLAIS